MRLRSLFLKSGFCFGLSLGTASVVAAGLGALLVGKVMEVENRAYIQQSIGDTSLILAKHFQSEFKALSDRLVEFGKEHLRVKASSDAASKIALFETDPDLIDVTLWKKGPNGNILDLNPISKPVFLAINSKYRDFSPKIQNQALAAMEADRVLIQAAFQGNPVIHLAPSSFDHKNIALIALPLYSGGASDEVVVAHFRLENLKKAFHNEGMVFALLVDQSGNVLAQPDSPGQIRKDRVSGTELFQSMHTSPASSGQLNYSDEQGNNFFGGYTRVGIGQMALLANVSESDANASLNVLKNQTTIFLIICFFTFFTIGYLASTRWNWQWGGNSASPASKSNKNDEIQEELKPSEDDSQRHPQRLDVVVMAGSLRLLNQLLELEDPQSAADSINEYFTVAASTVKAYGGLFEVTGRSFTAVWGAPSADGTEIWRALRCSLDLRQNYHKLNEARKVDGQKKLNYALGIHSGNVLVAKLGEMKDLHYRAVGDAVNSAFSLNQLCSSAQTDLLISQGVWQQSDAKFIGEPLGEAALSPGSIEIPYFGVSGYRNEQGEAVEIPLSSESLAVDDHSNRDVPKETETKQHKWLVNNGSQIIGPLTAEEIAARLFAQELDFDSECWQEGFGNSAQIKSARIFSGSEDKNASLWVFDGNIIHGPVHSGFLKTAIGHGAISESGYICEESTIQGWSQISEWILSHLPKDHPHSEILDPTLANQGASVETTQALESTQDQLAQLEQIVEQLKKDET